MPLLENIRPEPNPPLTIERVETARAMYVEGFTVARICSHCLMSLGTLYACLDGTPFGPDGPRFEPIPRRRNVLGQRTRPLRADPASLRNRLIRTAERQVREIELRLSLPDRPAPERERDIRMLGMTVKSLRELSRLEAAAFAPGEDAPGRTPDFVPGQDTFPQEFAELRRKLLEKLDAVMAEREAEETGRGESQA